MTQRVGCLLDFLPARGPVAFDEFCNALLECDHTHVAEYLKTMEGQLNYTFLVYGLHTCKLQQNFQQCPCLLKPEYYYA